VTIFATSTPASTDSGPFNNVSNFFSSGYFTAILRVSVLFSIAVWLALVFWTAKDARRRIDDPVIVAVCVAAAVLFGPLGVLIYLILRPPEYLDDVRERELEIKAMERRLGADQACPYCRSPVDAAFLSCPHCGTKLRNACRRCKSPLDPEWRLCPYCETAVAGPPIASRPRRDQVTERTTTEA
jgi:RNA polymerase subunit RPABC4/transcription elongation factor Spt4